MKFTKRISCIKKRLFGEERAKTRFSRLASDPVGLGKTGLANYN